MVEAKLGPKFYTAGEVAGILRVSMNSVYRYLKDGTIVGVRVGNRLYVAERDLDDYLERRRFSGSLAAPANLASEPRLRLVYSV